MVFKNAESIKKGNEKMKPNFQEYLEQTSEVIKESEYEFTVKKRVLLHKLKLLKPKMK